MSRSSTKICVRVCRIEELKDQAVLGAYRDQRVILGFGVTFMLTVQERVDAAGGGEKGVKVRQRERTRKRRKGGRREKEEGSIIYSGVDDV